MRKRHSGRKYIYIITIAIFLAIAIRLILIGYQFDWTGFNVYTITIKTNATSGTTLPNNITVYQPSKTLYDWMQLLIIPLVLAVAGYVINLTISRGEQEATKQRDKTERDIALDRQNEEILKDYIDKMSELLVHEDLRNLSKGDEVRKIADSWTALALSRLDSSRMHDVVAFLDITELIKVNNIVDLSKSDLDNIDLSNENVTGLNFRGTNMRGANLTNSNFTNANLSNANLTNANLSDADLTDADLTDADLTDAKVTRKQLSKAKSLKGATMPDGSIHP